ncbi:acyl-CoA thioesterase [Rhodovulum sp. DZ06]|uniref:acyl-CoA thioesterase n=1 Tax=Rhodovulum sp. DZ06 TaxID=3425126 RepID=UPI003D32C22B
MRHHSQFRVSFGDCDPAGIVFYPNFFRWLDACFHEYLAGHGGHEKVCESVGSIGLGLMDASARFRRPVKPGDVLTVVITGFEWSEKSLTLRYEGRLGDTVAMTGTEVRGMFIRTETGLRGGEMAPLRAILDPA